jgi:selenocysteine lyase/cysteine desulfurase
MKLPTDVDALQVDLLTVAAHKLHGPKGVGKSCAIDTALQGTCVLLVEVAPGTPQDAIVRAALEAVAGTHPNAMDPRPSVLRVLWWYSLQSLPPPIVLLRMSECSAGVPFAQTAGAVRTPRSH